MVHISKTKIEKQKLVWALNFDQESNKTSLHTRIMQTIKKLSVTLIFILYLSFGLNAQNSDNLSFKLTYGTVNSQQPDPTLTGTGTPMVTNYTQPGKSSFGLDANLSLSRSSDLGLYFNYSELYRLSVLQLDGDEPRWTYIFHPTVTLYYGLNYLYHIPFLTKHKKSRLDPYAIVRMGLVSEKYVTGTGTISGNSISYEYQQDRWDKPVFEAGLGIGANYYFTRNLGIFGEMMGGSFYNKQYFKWKTGFVIKF